MKIYKILGSCLRAEITAEHEGNGDINCCWCVGNNS